MKRLDVMNQLRKRREMWTLTISKIPAPTDQELANLVVLDQVRIVEILNYNSIESRLSEIQAALNLLTKGTVK